MWVEILVLGAVSWDTFTGSPGTTWVELLFLEPKFGKMLLSPWWVQLLVPRSKLGKFSRSLEGFGFGY